MMQKDSLKLALRIWGYWIRQAASKPGKVTWENS